MSRWSALGVRLTSVIFFTTLAATAGAESPAEIDCQSTIGREARRFASAAFEAPVDCNDAIVEGADCNAAQRDDRIARADARFARRVHAACEDVSLGNLGFPGTCSDGTGGEFTADDLIACLRTTIRSGLEEALAALFPDLAARTGDAAQCQKTIANQGETFFQGKLRARARCFERALKDDLEGVDCGAEIPPAGPGTGDGKTDQLIAKFGRRLADKIEVRRAV